MAVYPGRRFACPGLWRSLGFQPAWFDFQHTISGISVCGNRWKEYIFSPHGTTFDTPLGGINICGNRGDLWETLCADGAKNWWVICFPTDRRSTQKQKGNTIGVCIIRTRIILKNTNLANQSNDY